MSEPNVGLTEEERGVMDGLIHAWNRFVHLPNVSADDIETFRKTIHDGQAMLAVLVARRTDPKLWR